MQSIKLLKKHTETNTAKDRQERIIMIPFKIEQKNSSKSPKRIIYISRLKV